MAELYGWLVAAIMGIGGMLFMYFGEKAKKEDLEDEIKEIKTEIKDKVIKEDKANEIKHNISNSDSESVVDELRGKWKRS